MVVLVGKAAKSLVIGDSGMGGKASSSDSSILSLEIQECLA